MIMMVTFCSVALVIMGVVYSILWYRAKDKHQTFGTSTPSNPDSETPASVPKAKATAAGSHAPITHKKWEARERELGEPVYDTLLISGTVSLGVLMWIGATIVLIMTLVDQRNFKDASLGDFVSQGPNACLIENATSYNYYDNKRDALNTVCVEQWEYNVRVLTMEDTSFVSSPLSIGRCRAKCEICSSSRLFGPDFYVGVDPTKRGSSISNETLVECWAPSIPVEELSDFYPCGSQKESQGTCFLLQDTAVSLQERMNSSQIGLISAYACYAGGFLLLLVTAWFKWRNQQVLEQDREKLIEESEKEETKDIIVEAANEDNGAVVSTTGEDAAVKTLNEENGAVASSTREQAIDQTMDEENGAVASQTRAE